MGLIKCLVFFLLLFPAVKGLSQTAMDSVLQLEEVVIDVNRLANFSTGNKIQIIDSAILKNFHSSNLGDLLSQHSHVFIKSYGPGNLATISTRGTNSYQTAVLWNGFNLQGPTLGQTDFSQFPLSFAEEVKIQYGGSGSLFGTGAVGGIIHLNSPARFDQGISARILNNFGSFENYSQIIQVGVSKQKMISSIKFFNSIGKNDFPFVNGNLRVRQSHSAMKQKGALIENYFRINHKQQINLRVWLQENEREIPPIMTNSISDETLANNFLRMSSEWKRTGNKAEFFVRSAYFNDFLIYDDPSKSLHSKTHYQTSISEIESNVQVFKNHLLNVGFNNTYNHAYSEGFPDGKDQNRISAFASYKLRNNKDTWKTTLSLREELVDGRLIPFTSSLGFEGQIVKGLSLMGRVSRNYRIPTFNDLYWQPGGNSSLNSESGWGEELSINLDPVLKFLTQNKVSITFFNITMEDYIMWVPPMDDTSKYWSAQNINSVWSRGLESTLSGSKKIGDLKIDLSFLYSYVLSTNEKRKSINDEGFKKQLIYVPIYSGQGSLALSYRNFYLNYVQTYTGNRFTSTDNTEYIKGYLLGNIIVSKNFIFDNVLINCNARINNLWNTSYQAVLSQAMPLRNYQVGLSISFNKPNQL